MKDPGVKWILPEKRDEFINHAAECMMKGQTWADILPRIKYYAKAKYKGGQLKLGHRQDRDLQRDVRAKLLELQEANVARIREAARR